MTDEGSGRDPGAGALWGAAELAAQQVESIVSAAQAAAEQLMEEGRQEADAIRARGRQEAAEPLERARRQALELSADARREAERLLADARKEAAQTREQTRRAVEGRVAGAEEAADRVLEEARVLSAGLRRLGKALGEQGERIMRDVQTAHRRMQADLRVGPPDSDLPVEPLTGRFSRPARRQATAATRAERDDLDVPSWVER
jgi:hypothetical protein